MYVNWFVKWIACHANELFNSLYSYTHMNTLNNGWMHLIDSFLLSHVQQMINVFIMNEMDTKCFNSFLEYFEYNECMIWRHSDELNQCLHILLNTLTVRQINVSNVRIYFGLFESLYFDLDSIKAIYEVYKHSWISCKYAKL